MISSLRLIISSLTLLFEIVDKNESSRFFLKSLFFLWENNFDNVLLKTKSSTLSLFNKFVPKSLWVKMTKSTYKKLKRIDNLSILKNKILKIKTRINLVNSERKDLEKQSKIIKLKEKSNVLLEITNQYENLKLKMIF